MGVANHEIEMKEERWFGMAEAKGWRCGFCSGTPMLSEREAYFRSGLCAHCEHVINKDD
jgi:hypothetical protein